MKKNRLTNFVILVLFVTSCGSGGEDEITGKENVGSIKFADLSTVPIIYESVPIQNKKSIISFLTGDNVGEVSWRVRSQPVTSNLILNELVNNKVAFTASEVGSYTIVVRSASNSTEKATSFTITPAFSFDESKIEGSDGKANIDEIIGVIKNQSWVHSFSLSENELRNIVANYFVFSVIGYDVIEGLLIGYNETDTTAKESLEELSLLKGISSVENRVHEGENTPRDELISPNDGSSFNDGGDNWHLEDIGARIAWDYTTGSDSIFIGVSDSGFDTKHSELKGRVSEVLTSKKSDHGNGVAGAIGANTDNGSGISGINWTSQMILGHSGKSNLKPILGKDKVVVVNSSWAIPGYLPSSFSPLASSSVTKRNNKALSASRPYKKLARLNLNKLLVWSAGNGIDNGGGNSDGVYGVDGRHHSPALHYNKEGGLQK